MATTALRRQALKIMEAGLRAVDTQIAFARGFVYSAKRDRLRILDRRVDLSKFRNVYCVAFGKAAFAGIASVSEILGDRLTAGFAIDVAESHPEIEKIIFRTGTHPHPSLANVQAAKELVEFLSAAGANDLVLCLISGGGSALLCYPGTVDVELQAEIIKALMNGGADIYEMNAVRKHLSAVKGGRLAKIIYPAKLVSLIFSDVPGDDLSTIASGPTVRDRTTAREAEQILRKHDILAKLNLPSVKLLETPKEDKYFENAENILFVSARTAVLAMQNQAGDLGFAAKIFSGHFQGEARSLAAQFARENSKAHQAVIGAGESTVIVKGKGLGGRNQELALAALPGLAPDQALVSLASDGCDNSESAGAIVDISTIKKAKNLGLDFKQYLENNDSFSFFEAVGDSIHTGLTGSNVADLVLCLRA